MRSLMKNDAYAGKVFQASTSLRKYPVDDRGVVSIMADNPAKGTKDASEAKAAGFVDYNQGKRVLVINAEFGKRVVPKEILGDVEMVTIEAGTWEASETGHQYHADDDGKISIFEIDLDEAKSAGFTPVAG